MYSSQMIETLEDRRLLSASIAPVGLVLMDEPVHEYATISEKVRIAYLPKVNVSHVSQLSGAITWGDNTASLASFERDKHGGIDVMGTHAYAKPGTFSISAILGERPYVPPGQPTPFFEINLGTVDTTATVSPTPTVLIETATTPFTAVTARFHAFTVDTLFTAKISWGDGHTSTGDIQGGDLHQGNWDVSGNHTYSFTGLYKVHTYIYAQIAGSHFQPSVFEDIVTLIRVMGHA